MISTILNLIAHHWVALASGGAGVGILLAIVTALGPAAVLGIIKIVPRWCWEMLIVVALLLIFGWYARDSGERYVQAKWNKERAAQKQAVVAIEGKEEAVTTQTITQYVNRDHVVLVQGATITKQVPIYVTAENNAVCTINTGFVRLWNAANTGVQLPDAASAIDGQASGVKLSDVETQHSVESTYARSLEVEIETWQDWAAGQQKASK